MDYFDALEEHIDHTVEQRKIFEDILRIIQNSTQKNTSLRLLYIAFTNIHKNVLRLIQNNATELKCLQKQIKMQQKVCFSNQCDPNQGYLALPAPSQQPPRSTSSSLNSLLPMLVGNEDANKAYKITVKRKTASSFESIELDPTASRMQHCPSYNTTNFAFSEVHNERNLLKSSLNQRHNNSFLSDETTPRDLSNFNVEDISITTNHMEAHCSRFPPPNQYRNSHPVKQSTSVTMNQQMPLKRLDNTSGQSTLPLLERNSAPQLSSERNSISFVMEGTSFTQEVTPPVPSPIPNECLSPTGGGRPHSQVTDQEINDVLRKFIHQNLPSVHDWFEYARFGLRLTEQQINHIEENNKSNAFAIKYKKLQEWAKRRRFTSKEDVICQLENTVDKAFRRSISL